MPGRPHARRPIAVLVAAIASLAVLLVAATPAQASTVPGAGAVLTNVVSLAMRSLDQWQGECFPWVRSVMAEATGRVIGWDYRLGYLEAGAVEVPIVEVQSGDVVQIADDAATGPSVSYAGLHTAIVVENHGGGILTVIDSNSQWDGVVRMRTGYQPVAQAARYAGLTARAYRFPGVTAVTGLEGGSSAVTAGGSAIVSADGDCLRMRSAAGLGGAVLTCLPDGTVVTVLEASTTADGILWRQVSALGTTGWVAEQYLTALPGTPLAPAAAPAPAGSTSTTAAGTTTPTAPATGQISGTLPTAGGVGLVVWSGGPVTTLVGVAQAQGCNAGSVWATVDGRFVGYTAGAPAFVNRGWEALYPGGTVPGATALVVICARATASSPPASIPSPAPGVGPAPAQPGGTPPGPAGNE